MNLMERTYSVLIVSAAENLNHTLAELLPSYRFSTIKKAASVSAASRILSGREYDMIIINAPLPDDAGLRFALDAAKRGGSIVLFIVRAAMYNQIYTKLSPHGIFTIAKPLSKQNLSAALDWMISARERVRILETKTVSIEEKMEEIRLVNRAKWILIDKQNMDEPGAHRRIEKQAMDQCVTRREIAEDIIREYAKN